MTEFKSIIEALLLAAGAPLSLDDLSAVFPEEERPPRHAIRTILSTLATEYNGRGMELVEVASGFRLQVPISFAPWVARLRVERTTQYSRALLETLALIAYRQPITRSEIEEVRGVSLSSSIMQTLRERGWIRVIGHRPTPGRPALYVTTKDFLDYFNLRSLSELPALVAPRSFEMINAALEAEVGNSAENYNE